ncbi:MAG TPA: hypothetical protein PLV68_07765, partial [Ilumatobacteraceae bacterium]|nr:hypothetical protein [Ilumatobacteraceae bacterium]
WTLLVFPNTFEYFFIAYEAIRTRWDPRRLSAHRLVGLAAAIWNVVKLPQEWWIHIARLDATDEISAHPWIWLVLLGAAATLTGAVWSRRDRIPAADWSFTTRVDAHLPRFDPDAGPWQRFFTMVLVEKVVLLTLICVIFAQVLPDVGSTNLQLAVGVAVLVVANAAISQSMRHRGRSWPNIISQFGAMLTVNMGIVSVDAVLSPRGGDNTPELSTVFFMVLLAMLIALFDRYRATRNKIDKLPGAITVWKRERAGRGTPQAALRY